jgi:uncharacterized protein YjgD (DUF1641 family)
MAKPVSYRVLIPADAREQVKRKIDEAPLEHAEAVLGGYRLLEEAHRSGVLEMLRGALAAEDSVITQVADTISQPEIVNAMRNLMVLGQVLGGINPDSLKHAMERDGAGEKGHAPPSLFALLSRFNTGDARRGLHIVAGLLAVVGAAARPKR